MFLLSPDESGEVLAIYLLSSYKSTHTDAEERYMLLCLYADAPHPQRIHARLPRQYSYFCTSKASKVRGPYMQTLLILNEYMPGGNLEDYFLLRYRQQVLSLYLL
jgi:hypothetical protein